MCIKYKAFEAMKALNGIVCLYKPAGLSVAHIKKSVITNLCRDLNQLETRPPDLMVEILGATNAPMTVNLTTNLADHPLVVGPRYQAQDFKAAVSTPMGKYTSGVLLLGINEGTKLTWKMHKSRPIRAYKVHGKLGAATDTFFSDGKIVEKAFYKQVTRGKIDRVVAYMQSMHQRKMHEMSGIDMSSQAGYELMSSGLIRPSGEEVPVIYGMKCVHFQSPHFVIELQSINEYEKYLHTLIHDIGMQLKTVAHCTQAQCIRQGKFTLEHALLRKHWNLDDLLYSMRVCGDTLNENQSLIRPKAELSL